MIINIKLEEITIFDISNPDPLKQIKLISDFNLNYQLFAEAKFILWKFLAILTYGEIDLKDYAVSNSYYDLDTYKKNNI
jgi:hypothetical protein